MAIRIDAFEMIEFEIPTGKGRFQTIELPPMDCWTAGDIEKINSTLAQRREEDAEIEKELLDELDLLRSRKEDKADIDGAAKALADHRARIALSPNNNPVELNRFLLKFFNPAKAKSEAIDGLVSRYINEIAREWEAQSGIDSGKSDDSTDSSSEISE
ncbi:hypothetical protein [Corynebacterium callunae]|uniref:hypothetical protein n=1 Tax=Corynebacterium callunae TaxID=1721 RepID=UPI0020002D33|nr:hypothetical protein [Corynebacterium callunae]MCK2200179.1 hypothetical protein [Corynebacterium callunae]